LEYNVSRSGGKLRRRAASMMQRTDAGPDGGLHRDAAGGLPGGSDGCRRELPGCGWRKNTILEAGGKYQARPTDKVTVHIKEMIKAPGNDLNAMDSVADVSTVDLTKMNTT